MYKFMHCTLLNVCPPGSKAIRLESAQAVDLLRREFARKLAVPALAPAAQR